MMSRAIPILSGALVLSAALAAPAAAQPDLTPVFLSVEFEGERCTIRAVPDPATLFWDHDPKKLRFFANTPGYYWEIEWKGTGASGGKPNFFPGKPLIKCNQTRTSVLSPAVGRTDDAIWPYKIAVFRCVSGEKGDELPCSPKDPIVEWGD